MLAQNASVYLRGVSRDLFLYLSAIRRFSLMSKFLQIYYCDACIGSIKFFSLQFGMTMSLHLYSHQTMTLNGSLFISKLIRHMRANY